MADGFVQVAPDSTGKKVDNEEITTGAGTVERQRVRLGGLAAAELADVRNATPGGTDYGIVTRNIPSGTQPVSGTFWQATQPVSGTFWQATQPVSGPLTDAQLRATAVPVSGTFWQATQPVSGPLTDTQLRASAVPVSGTFFQATQPVSGTVTANIGTAGTLALDATLTGGSAAVQLGTATGKTNVLKTGALTTTAVTADQVILTYTVTTGKTFYLQYFQVEARLTTFAATTTLFGTFSLEIVAGTKVFTLDIANAGVITPQGVTFTEPIPIPAGTVVRLVCTPAATTSFAWKGAFGGYEK
jgi:hypothetical protein